MQKINLTKQQHIWDLSPLFASDSDPAIAAHRKKVQSAHETFVTKWHKRNDYLTDVVVAKEALDEYEGLMRNIGLEGDEGYYFALRSMQDQLNPELKAKFAKVLDFSNELNSKIQFFELNLAKITKENQQTFLAAKELKPYTHFLKRIFDQAPYMLSEEAENILNLKADPAHGRWQQLLSGFISKEVRTVTDETGKQVEKTFEQLITMSSSTDKNVRDEAAKAVNDIFSKLADVAEAELNAILTNKKIDDSLRGMDRPDRTRLLGDDIDTDFIDTLLDTVTARNDIAHDFYKLKAELLGVEKLAYHERNVELAKTEKEYPYDEACTLVDKVFTGLDPEFGELFRSFLENKQIDVYPRVGKRGGACCIHLLITQPTYILLNYNNRQRDVETLAHEMGHGINNELIKKKQNALNYGVPMVTAEVASTFMEDFVLQEILKSADEETRFEILMSKLNADISSIFRQLACYQFEQALHNAIREKGYLSKEDIGKLFQKYMSGYMGPYVDQSEGSENWWIYWKHIRMFFYVYSYGSGLLISKAMQNAVKKDPTFIQKVKVFLSAGTTAAPKDIFAAMDIDINNKDFWLSGLQEVEDLLKETRTLAKKLGKIS